MFERHGKEVTEAVFEKERGCTGCIEKELRLAEDAFETAAVLHLLRRSKGVYEELKHRGKEAAYIDRGQFCFREGK